MKLGLSKEEAGFVSTSPHGPEKSCGNCALSIRIPISATAAEKRCSVASGVNTETGVGYCDFWRNEESFGRAKKAMVILFHLVQGLLSQDPDSWWPG